MSATRRLEFIARTQLTGAAASVSFATGLSGFTKFFLVAYVVNDGVGTKNIRVTLNNDTGANYSNQTLSASAATITGQRVAGHICIMVDNNGGPLAVSQAAVFVAEISKPVAGEVARATVRLAINSTISYEATAAEWTNTAAVINRIDVTGSVNNYAAGTRVLLYGSKD